MWWAHRDWNPMSACDRRRTSASPNFHNGSYGMRFVHSIFGSFNFGARELDHLAPLVGVIDDEFAKIGGRAGKRCAADFGKPRPELGIGKHRVDLFVELVDDFAGRRPWRAKAVPLAR